MRSLIIPGIPPRSSVNVSKGIVWYVALTT